MGFLKDKLDSFVWQVAAKRAIGLVVKVTIAFLTSKAVAPELAKYGVSVDPTTLTNGLTLILTAVLDAAHHFLESKKPA